MKTKSTHTPGRWQYWKTLDDYAIAAEKSMKLVTTSAIAFVPLLTKQSEANARLIAAAPELLESLRMFCIEHTNPCGCENCAVIRKAEGDLK